MARMEVITRAERRRRYSDAERAAVLAQCDAPGATIVGVARQLGMSPSLIHGWRKRQREMALLTSEPLQFVPYGEVASGSAAEPLAALRDTEVAASSRATARETRTTQEELIRPNPGLRPGGIDIDLPGGVRLSVDTYVNEKALARVLRALRETA
ncbi:IS66-like element accessory protein TnpA [Sphingomonas sp. TDK1]|uniref:IS66-like element accessory protein TnpA n=1 Tax=Sphingomonas sp. TDK1 TaxID=453247 RepID=UPI0007D9BF86|nr:transposase [Sphingomonas sp. TDK1]OAN61552.1 transposase [Sphingomonas sp. TDK1]